MIPSEENESAIPTFGIPDDLCKQAGLTAKWGPGEKLVLHAAKHKTYKSQDQASEYSPCVDRIHQVMRSTPLFHPVVRKLVNETNGIFLAVQNLKSENEKGAVEAQIVKLSKQYRSVLKDCLDNFEKHQIATTEDERETVSSYKALFQKVAFLWHLTEILCIDIVPGSALIPLLLEWIQFNFGKPQDKMNQILKGGYNDLPPERHPDYWDTVLGLVLQGRMDSARNMLQAHTASQSDMFVCANELLLKMPRYNLYEGPSAVELQMRWDRWQGTCRNSINNGTFSTRGELEFIIKVIAGYENIFQEVQKKCETWYEYMVAQLLYNYPNAQSYELSQYAKNCMTLYGVARDVSPEDSIIIAIMESDIIQAIREIDTNMKCGWFAAHLTDLLYHCGSFESPEEQQLNAYASMSMNAMSGMLSHTARKQERNRLKSEQSKFPEMKVIENITDKLREHLLLEYGTLLMSHHALWQVGITYLDHCPTEGKARLEALLPTVTLTSEARALKIIQIAKERGLNYVMVTICKVLGMRAYREQKLGMALTWALRSQDANFTTYLADKFLEEYSKEGKFHSMDLLDNLGSCMLVSDRLTFLGKYCEFHRLYRASDFRPAATLLISLLNSRLAPKYFWLTLLMDALPMLESNDIIFTSEETYELMHCLEELFTDNMAKLEDEANSLLEKKNLIQLALARNLARSLTFEGCLGS